MDTMGSAMQGVQAKAHQGGQSTKTLKVSVFNCCLLFVLLVLVTPVSPVHASEWGHGKPLFMRCPQCPHCPHAKTQGQEEKHTNALKLRTALETTNARAYLL